MYCMGISSGQVTSLSRVTDVGQCVTGSGQILLLEPADVPPNPLFMSVEDGLILSGAIATLWCIAWAARVVRLAL